MGSNPETGKYMDKTVVKTTKIISQESLNKLKDILTRTDVEITTGTFSSNGYVEYAHNEEFQSLINATLQGSSKLTNSGILNDLINVRKTITCNIPHATADLGHSAFNLTKNIKGVTTESLLTLKPYQVLDIINRKGEIVHCNLTYFYNTKYLDTQTILNSSANMKFAVDLFLSNPTFTTTAIIGAGLVNYILADAKTMVLLYNDLEPLLNILGPDVASEFDFLGSKLRDEMKMETLLRGISREQWVMERFKDFNIKGYTIHINNDRVSESLNMKRLDFIQF